MSSDLTVEETRDGYEQVQLGPRKVALPTEWEIQPVNKLFKIEKNSFNPDKLDSDSEVLLYSMPAFDSGREPTRIPASDIGSKKYRVPQDTILFPKLNIRKRRFWRVQHSHSQPAVCSTEFWPLVPEVSLALDFYHYYFDSHEFMSNPKVTSSSSTNSHKRVKQTSFEKLQLPFPPLAEQRRIADILSTVDERIQQTNEAIEKTKELKQGLMQELLFSGINHNYFKNINFGPESIEIPESWDMIRLDDVVEKYRGGASLSSDDFTDDGIPVIPKGGINQRGILRIPEEDQQYCSIEYANSNDSSLVTGDDLVTVSRDLVSSAPNIGRIVEIPDREYLIAQGVNSVTVNEDRINPKFLIHMSNSQPYRHHMKRIKVGSTQVHVRRDDFLSTPIPCPPIKEQDEIVDILSIVEQRIQQETTRESELKELKRGLMQDLLTGKVRVNSDNAD